MQYFIDHTVRGTMGAPYNIDDMIRLGAPYDIDATVRMGAPYDIGDIVQQIISLVPKTVKINEIK